MDDTILVAYATRYGSTKEIASAIADTLRSGGESVDLLPVEEVTDLGRYRAAVVGSPIYMGKWLSDAQTLYRTEADRTPPDAGRLLCCRYDGCR